MNQYAVEMTLPQAHVLKRLCAYACEISLIEPFSHDDVGRPMYDIAFNFADNVRKHATMYKTLAEKTMKMQGILSGLDETKLATMMIRLIFDDEMLIFLIKTLNRPLFSTGPQGELSPDNFWGSLELRGEDYCSKQEQDYMKDAFDKICSSLINAKPIGTEVPEFNVPVPKEVA